MSEPVVLKATYASFRHVPSRKVLQVVFELPIEQAQHAMTVLGVPTPDSAQWFAIAALQPGAPTKEHEAPPVTPKGRQWNELRPSTQAALRCKQPRFQQWLQTDNEVRAQFELSKRLGGVRKRELDADPVLGQQWRTLDAEFQAHCIAQGYEGLA